MKYTRYLPLTLEESIYTHSQGAITKGAIVKGITKNKMFPGMLL